MNSTYSCTKNNKISEKPHATTASHLEGRAEVVRPALLPAARLALEVKLILSLQLVHALGVLLLDGPRHIRAVGRLVATVLAREAAVGVAHLALVVALERVEVV